jgi:hypothetical protein
MREQETHGLLLLCMHIPTNSTKIQHVRRR